MTGLGAVNYSNTGVLLSTLKGTANSLAVLLGSTIGGPIGAVAGHAAGPLGTKIKENMAASALRKSLYQPATRTGTTLPPNWKNQALINAVLGAQAGDQRRPSAGTWGR